MLVGWLTHILHGSSTTNQYSLESAAQARSEEIQGVWSLTIGGVESVR